MRTSELDGVVQAIGSLFLSAGRVGEGKSNFYPGMRAPSRTQKKKRDANSSSQRRFAVFLFQPGRNRTSARSRRTSGAIREILVGTRRSVRRIARVSQL